MKKSLRNAFILVLPFILMISINEIERMFINEQPYKYLNVTAENSGEMIPDRCTWICHNNTQYCLQHHVKLLKPYTSTTNKIYFGTIDLLASSGNYGAANIIFLVVFAPLLIWFFLIKSIDAQFVIKQNKKESK